VQLGAQVGDDLRVLLLPRQDLGRVAGQQLLQAKISIDTSTSVGTSCAMRLRRKSVIEDPSAGLTRIPAQAGMSNRFCGSSPA
jgi:hypothetical protein